MLGWLIRLLLLAFLLRLVMKAVSRVLPRELGRAPRPSPRVPSSKRGELVRDPICGTYVEPSRSVSTRSGDESIYFCSETCRQAFLESA